MNRIHTFWASLCVIAALAAAPWLWWRTLVGRDEADIRRYRAAYLAGAPWPAPTRPRDEQWRSRWR